MPLLPFGSAPGGMKIGGDVSGGTAGSVLFIGADGTLSENNPGFTFDATNLIVGRNIISDSDSTDDLGSTAKYWANVYTDKLNLSNTTSLNGISAGIIKSLGDIVPTVDSTDDLGSSSIFWKDLYVDKIFLNSTAILDGAIAGHVGVGSGQTVETFRLTPDADDVFLQGTNVGLILGHNIYRTDSAWASDNASGLSALILMQGNTIAFQFAAASATPSPFGYMSLDTTKLDMKVRIDMGGNIINSGLIRPTIDSTYNLGQANKSYKTLYVDNIYGPTVFNEDSLDRDFRFEGLNNENLLMIDAGNDNITINAAAISANYDLALAGDGVLALKETTTPTADAGYAKIYTKDNNELFYQSGDGAEHLLHGDAFSNLWFHSVTKDTIAISTADTFTLIDSFENIGEEDDLANTVSNTTNNDITIGTNGGGKYKMTFHTSITSNGAASEMVIAMGVTLNTPIDVTGATNATPIVVTSVAHGLFNGDMITIVGGTTNTAVNGDWIITAKTDDTFTLVDLSGSDSVGNGVYDASSGDVTIDYPGNLPMHRQVSQTDLGVGGSNADHNLVAGDKVKLYVANIGATRDLEIAIVNMEIFRIGD